MSAITREVSLDIMDCVLSYCRYQSHMEEVQIPVRVNVGLPVYETFYNGRLTGIS